MSLEIEKWQKNEKKYMKKTNQTYETARASSCSKKDHKCEAGAGVDKGTWGLLVPIKVWQIC